MKPAKSKTKELPIIICECGTQIDVSNDLSKTVSNIEIHIADHKKKLANPKEAEIEAERIEDLLLEQIVEAAYDYMS
jgi:hypothetical protein